MVGLLGFQSQGDLLVETLSESKSFLKRQTLLIFLLFSIFLRLYKKSKAIEKWIIKKLEDLHLPKKRNNKNNKKNQTNGVSYRSEYFCECVRVSERVADGV